MKRFSLIVMTLLVCCAPTAALHADIFTFVSDLITTSALSTNANHTIIFTTVHPIPAGATIKIEPAPGTFTIPIGFDYTDIDLAVAPGLTYIDRSLAAAPDAVSDGVSVVTGSSGSITFTLNSTTGIGAGERVRVLLGTNANFEVTGTQMLNNSAVQGSYRIRIYARDLAQSEIDRGTAMIAILPTVGVFIDAFQPPVIRSNGLPQGTLEAGNTSIELSLDTDQLATCRFATTTGVAYAAMLGRFSPTLGTSFTTVVAGFQDGQTYNFYVRCTSLQNSPNLDDYLISFTLKPTPDTLTSLGVGNGVNGRGGVGDFPDGSSQLYLSTITFTGWSIPGSTVTVLKDGRSVATTPVKSDGTFQTAVTDLERGTYSFNLYTVDHAGHTSSAYTATMTVTSGTHNAIASIVIPPTIVLSQESIGEGDGVSVSGESIPGRRIEVTSRNRADSGALSDLHTYGATSSTAGIWKLDIPKGILKKGTYIIRARAFQSDDAQSDPSAPILLTAGESGLCRAKSSDINGDKKVNLIDFSIMLSSWNTRDSKSDLNCDDFVNLADFSILLFNWTG